MVNMKLLAATDAVRLLRRCSSVTLFMTQVYCRVIRDWLDDGRELTCRSCRTCSATTHLDIRVLCTCRV